MYCSFCQSEPLCAWYSGIGDYENGIEHLTNAIAVCGQPQQLLQVLQQTLPPPVFQMLLTKLPTISQVQSFSLLQGHLANTPTLGCLQ
jgi:hypothetical protein